VKKMFEGLRKKIKDFLERLAKAGEDSFGSTGPLCCHQTPLKSSKLNKKKIRTTK
jgi:hypothetical protein